LFDAMIYPGIGIWRFVSEDTNLLLKQSYIYYRTL